MIHHWVSGFIQFNTPQTFTADDLEIEIDENRITIISLTNEEILNTMT
jgi:hypothetical protein